MVKEKCKITNDARKKVTRVCDDCGNEKLVVMNSVFRGRRIRGEDKDLCQKCSSSAKNKPEGCWPRGKSSHLWKGGRQVYRGHVKLHLGPMTWKYEHRDVMEKHLKRLLVEGEIVHHLDMNGLNNEISNLYLLPSATAHRLLHAQMESLGFRLYGKLIYFDKKNKVYATTAKAFEWAVDTRVPEGGKVRGYANIEGLNKEYIFRNAMLEDHRWTKVYRHVVIAEAHIGRRLYKNECVHHIDNNGRNNHPDNLIVLTISEHGKAQRSIQNCVAELYRQGKVRFVDGRYEVVE